MKLFSLNKIKYDSVNVSQIVQFAGEILKTMNVHVQVVHVCHQRPFKWEFVTQTH